MLQIPWNEVITGGRERVGNYSADIYKKNVSPTGAGFWRKELVNSDMIAAKTGKLRFDFNPWLKPRAIKWVTPLGFFWV